MSRPAWSQLCRRLAPVAPSCAASSTRPDKDCPSPLGIHHIRKGSISRYSGIPHGQLHARTLPDTPQITAAGAGCAGVTASELNRCVHAGAVRTNTVYYFVTPLAMMISMEAMQARA